MPASRAAGACSRTSARSGNASSRCAGTASTSARKRIAQRGLPVDALSDDQLRAVMQQLAEDFRDKAPLTAAAAATIILDGVREGRWRMLVGQDAEELDRMVRAAPERAYEPGFMEELRAKGHFDRMVQPPSGSD